MAHDPKLEIYRLKLNFRKDDRPATFRQLFRNKFNNYGNNGDQVIPIQQIFQTYYRDFLKKIDLKGYNKNDKKKKAFTIAKDKIAGGEKSRISSPTAKDTIICGILDGGKYGLKRSLGEVEDTNKKTAIDEKHIVGDLFFFLLYTPLEHSEGILMIQGYTELKISDIVRDHLVQYFTHEKEIECKIQIYVPTYLKEKYLQNAVFKSLKFSTSMPLPADFSGEVPQNGYEFEVKIEIVDKSKKASDYKIYSTLVQALGKSIFKLGGGKEKELAKFDKKAAKMSSDGKERPIDFDDEDNVKPVILLKDQGIKILEGGIPDFDGIEVFCRNLLTEVTREIMPVHAIEEL